MTKDEQIEALAAIVETCCIELKKDNSIAARRKQANKQRKKMVTVLEKFETVEDAAAKRLGDGRI